MEKIKNTIRKNLALIMSIIAAVLIIGGIVLIVLGINLANSTFNKVMFIIMSVVMILLGCVMTYFVFLTREELSASDEPNLFLYDKASGKNLSPDILSFELINKRMGFFMSCISSSLKEIWSEDIFEREEVFDGVDEMRVLLAYKMLYDLADKDAPMLWGFYLNAPQGLINSICDSIESNGDEFGRYIVKLYAAAGGNYEKSRKFLIDNKSYIEKKMFKCASENIEKF